MKFIKPVFKFVTALRGVSWSPSTRPPSIAEMEAYREVVRGNNEGVPKSSWETAFDAEPNDDARFLDCYPGVSFKDAGARIRNSAFEFFRDYCTNCSVSVSNILVTGIGSGVDAKFASDFFPKSDVTVVDADAYSLALARLKPNLNSVNFVYSDLLAFDDGTFDAVLCAYAFYKKPLQESKKALKEIARVLKKGGVLLVLDEVKSPQAVFEKKIEASLNPFAEEHRVFLGKMQERLRYGGFARVIVKNLPNHIVFTGWRTIGDFIDVKDVKIKEATPEEEVGMAMSEVLGSKTVEFGLLLVCAYAWGSVAGTVIKQMLESSHGNLF